MQNLCRAHGPAGPHVRTAAEYLRPANKIARRPIGECDLAPGRSGVIGFHLARQESIRNTPDRFWYLNNGITVLCSSIAKAPIHGDARDIGLFECQGVSVVNGAQTLGVIWESAKRSQDINKSKARVHVRLISLENCPDGFDRAVTKATNTQNRIEQRDFAALDALQQRLAREMALDGRRYAFKSGDPDPRNGDGCSIEEAAVALACANQDAALAVNAKREISTLWRDITKPPYTTLFNDRTSARDLWRAVVVLRAVEAELEDVDKTAHPRGDLIAVHGNRFILHHVFRDPAMRAFRDPAISEADLRTKAKGIADRVFADTCQAVQTKYASAYPANLFKSAPRCKDLLDKSAPVPGPIGPLFDWTLPA